MLTWLSAAVAFSLSMIVFSTIVSALTEFLHRLFHMRESGLRRMLEQLYEQHLAPELLGVSGTAARKPARDFSDRITRNLAFGLQTTSHFLGPIGHWYAPRRLQSLSWIEFVRRVAETPVGAALRERAAPELERAVNDLAVRFERFGADASAYFQQRARAISITVAVLLALALNVDAVRLFSTFLQDRALTEQVIAHADQVVDAFQQQGVAASEAGEDEVEALRESAARVRKSLDSPLLAGLPIGFGVYPWCQAAGEPDRDPRCTTSFREDPWPGLTWLLSVLIAGFLIGLGGPFWFGAYSKLASILGAARPAAKRSPEGDKDVAAGAAAADAEPPGLHADPLQAFAAALPSPLPSRPRTLLTREGRPFE